MPISRFQILVVLTSLLTVANGQQDGIQTIFGHPTYSRLRPCAQNCFHIHMGHPVTYLRDLLGSRLGCPIVRTTSTLSLQVAENNCFCRADLQRSAEIVISQCVVSRCAQNENDVVTAVAMYNGYCAANGYAAVEEGQATATAESPLPTEDGETATPGARATGGQNSPTGLPGRSSASSVQTTSAAIFLYLISIVVANIIFT